MSIDLARLRATSDSQLLDDVDELYDLMVEAGERQDEERRARYATYHDIASAEAFRRGLITIQEG